MRIAFNNEHFWNIRPNIQTDRSRQDFDQSLRELKRYTLYTAYQLRKESTVYCTFSFCKLLIKTLSFLMMNFVLTNDNNVFHDVKSTSGNKSN